MTLKMIGTLLVLIAGTIVLRNYFQKQHYVNEQIAELIWALQHIVSEIRWNHRCFPEILEDLSKGIYSGETFEIIAGEMTSQITLQELWNREFMKYCREIAEVMLRVDLTGDEQHLTGGLLYASEELKRLQDERKKRRQNEGKLYIALVCTGMGLLLILLI